MVLYTNRLTVRKLEISDTTFYFELFNDPGWIQFISDKNLKTIAQTKKYLEEELMPSLCKNGLGFFTVIESSSNVPIGAVTILKREKLDFLDVGYAFLPKGRGKGYAIEATKRIMKYALEVLKQEKVLAITMPENKASQRVLNSIGFDYVGLQNVFENNEDCVYEFVF